MIFDLICSVTLLIRALISQRDADDSSWRDDAEERAAVLMSWLSFFYRLFLLGLSLCSSKDYLFHEEFNLPMRGFVVSPALRVALFAFPHEIRRKTFSRARKSQFSPVMSEWNCRFLFYPQQRESERGGGAERWWCCVAQAPPRKRGSEEAFPIIS